MTPGDICRQHKDFGQGSFINAPRIYLSFKENLNILQHASEHYIDNNDIVFVVAISASDNYSLQAACIISKDTVGWVWLSWLEPL